MLTRLDREDATSGHYWSTLELDDPAPAQRERPSSRLRTAFARLHEATRQPPRWWQETVLLLIGFGLYQLIQDKVPLHGGDAVARGRTLLETEDRWHIDWLHPMNAWLGAHRYLAMAANYYYVALHFTVPIGIMVWLLVRHRNHYRTERRALLLMLLLALAVFWFAPTAPPRLVPGSYVLDTLSYFHTIGGYSSGPTKHAADQFASMPSEHLAFALWCAVTMFRRARSSLVRHGWFLYPAMTSADVLATGNHYVFDLLAGAAALGLGYLLSMLSSVLARRLDPGRPPPQETLPNRLLPARVR